MRFSVGIPLILLFLTGCPTPPEDVQGAAGNSNAPSGPGGNGQGGNGPGGNGPGGNGQAGSGPDGSGTNGPPGKPPGSGENGSDSLGQNEGTNGPPGAPPNGEGSDTEGGPGQVGQYPNADGENADPNNMNQNMGGEGGAGGDAGAGGQTPDGQAGNQAGDQGGQQGGPPPGQGGQGGEGGEGGGPPPGPVEGQLLIKVDKENNTQPQYTQEDLGTKSNVTFSGVVKCDGCKGDLVLRATKFIGQDDQPTEDLVTTKKLDGPGKFTILLPESDDPVNFELLVDENQDGKPSKGERFAVLEIKDELPTKDQSGFELDASDGDLDNIPEADEETE